MEKKIIGILGLGTMGIGIAHTFAEYGYPVIAVDNQQAALNKFDELLEQSYKTQCFFEKPKSTLAAIKDRIQKTQDIHFLQDCDYVFDNTTESIENKNKLLADLNKFIKPNCIIAINTSCIPITSLSKYVDCPERMLGMHFMNPVPIKRFVEIIKTKTTSEKTLENIMCLLESIEKSGEIVNDFPGFVINRVFMVTINEAIKVLEEKICQTPNGIDDLFVKCLGHRMGPLMTADLIGLDTILYSLNVLHREFNNNMYLPAKLLVDLVDQGKLGRKSGQGLYNYN